MFSYIELDFIEPRHKIENNRGKLGYIVNILFEEKLMRSKFILHTTEFKYFVKCFESNFDQNPKMKEI